MMEVFRMVPDLAIGEAPSPLRGRRWREAPDEGGAQSAQQEPKTPLIRPSGTFSRGGEKGLQTETGLVPA
jgi:hypothetical protein